MSTIFFAFCGKCAEKPIPPVLLLSLTHHDVCGACGKWGATHIIPRNGHFVRGPLMDIGSGIVEHPEGKMVEYLTCPVDKDQEVGYTKILKEDT